MRLFKRNKIAYIELRMRMDSHYWSIRTLGDIDRATTCPQQIAWHVTMAVLIYWPTWNVNKPFFLIFVPSILGLCECIYMNVRPWVLMPSEDFFSSICRCHRRTCLASGNWFCSSKCSGGECWDSRRCHASRGWPQRDWPGLETRRPWRRGLPGRKGSWRWTFWDWMAERTSSVFCRV